MKQIVIISGKGGTGKTVSTASFAWLCDSAVIADCDVDAADMHLILKPEVLEQGSFKSGATAVCTQEECVQCGKCLEVCRFDAVSDAFSVDPIGCEGCGFCARVCPTGAMKMVNNDTGVWYVSETRAGCMVHAELGTGEENSGKLVSLVRQKAKEQAEREEAEWVIIDGSPGIGCPVIASLADVNAAVIVIEPTVSGIHDAERVIKVARHFKIPVMVLINKYDLNIEMTEKAEKFCEEESIPLLGRIPFDRNVVDALVESQTVIEYAPRSEAAEAYKLAWERIMELS